jgi:hypothetical protein
VEPLTVITNFQSVIINPEPAIGRQRFYRAVETEPKVVKLPP